ncbi:ABC transporter ATP-binding protein [Candidatus Peregrinibacteria bacterium CG_4_10_14_0_2_um_filter_38_24]|nr:MAG: ABC transporter ATP-binding protein [Candidatus Peregrinibacteria bacterium CG_4_10_14_0_2_um_filter_38_24]PJC38969.1 MAG: ABC transporter ATP-binding protein [Candidatus Peregrinibacteria bacterium CG_4_9_14_0_2_um_filter_38_9]
MENIVEVKNLNFNYGVAEVLKDVTFSIEKGDYVGLGGHNGSGKTTLVKIILGVLSSNSGDVFVFGQNVNKFKKWHKIGYLPQNISLFNPIFPATVYEVVSLGLISRKKFPRKITKEDEKIVDDALEELEIFNLKDRLISDLSGGQQQRVFLAKALVNEPELLILDEPSNTLDARTRNKFFNLLNDLNKKKGTTIILITHDIGHIGEHANKLLYLEKSVVFYGKLSEFCDSEKMEGIFGHESQHLICHQH